MEKNKSVFKSKKMKYGSYAVVFIACFIALIIGLNLIVSVIDNSVDLRFDLTEQRFYSLSDETDETMKIALGDKYGSFDISITFCAAKDMFTYYDSSRSDVNKYYSAVVDIAEEYAKLYDGKDGKGKVTVNYVDITSDPAEANRLMQQAQLTTISWKNIIIANNNDRQYCRVLGFDTCYYTDSNTGSLYAFQAENKLTAAIIQCVSAENITVAFTTGQGESHSSRIDDIFVLSTMIVSTIDLEKQDIPSDVQIIVISDPQKDFTVDEITKLSDFMSNKSTFKSMMVFVDADTPDLPNLRDYISEQWGIDYLPNHKIIDENASVKGTNFEGLIGTYCAENSKSAASAIVQKARQSGLSSVFPNAVELTADTTGNRSQIPEIAVYSSSSSSVSYKNDEGQLVKENGSFPIMAISTVHSYENDDFQSNSNKYQYVMLFGSTGFASDAYLNNSYGNEDIMFAATRVMATDRVTLDIREKVFGDSALTLESGQAKRLMIIITCAIPVIIVIVGVSVFFRRRHL